MSIMSAQGYIGDTFGGIGAFIVPSKQLGDPPFTLTPPTSNSPGGWTFTSSDSNVLSISGATATVVGTGAVIVTATQDWVSFYGSQSVTTNMNVASAATDPYYTSTTMLIGGEPRGAGYANFLDSAGVSNPAAVNNAGQAAKTPNSSFAGSMCTQAISDYITGSVAIGNSDFSIEFWVYPNAISGNCALFSTSTTEQGAASLLIWATTTGITFYSSTQAIVAPVGNISGVWTHIALAKIGNVFTLYVNGASQGTFTGARTFAGSLVQINHGYGGATNGVMGFYSNVRLNVGSSAYTANFTKPTAPVNSITNTRWLLNFGNAMVVDKSYNGYGLLPSGSHSINTSIVKYGSGSVYFNGGTTYSVTPATTAQWNWAATGYTIEAWLYPTSLGGSVRPIVSQSTSTVTNEWEFVFNTSSQLVFRYWTGAARTVIDTGTTVALNTWSHVAMTFDGSSIRIFVNGTLKVTTAYIAAQVAGLVNLVIGGSGGGLEGGSLVYFAGYMDDFRMTSACRYTANFTPLTYAAPSA